jgi:hypothetical protein
MKRQMQKVIKNLGKNLDSMNVYSLLILNIGVEWAESFFSAQR